MIIDQYGINCYDENDRGKEIVFFLGGKLEIKSKFYEIINEPNNIIKCPSLIDYDKEIEMLQRFNDIRKDVKKTDLPSGYYQEKSIIRGEVIPYYMEAPTLFDLSIDKDKSKINNYYYKSDDKIRNMFILYNEILDIIEELYDNNICYYDSNSTNFVFKDNNVHLIDFDYKHISYKKNRRSLYKVLIGIDDLVDRMNNRFLAHDEFIYFPRSFNSMRKHLVKLENRIRKG